MDLALKFINSFGTLRLIGEHGLVIGVVFLAVVLIVKGLLRKYRSR